MRSIFVWLCALALPAPMAMARDYQFDGGISEPVLRNYLSRSITMLDLLTGKGNVDDNLRMLKNMGAKFAGRSIYLWGHEGDLPAKLATARRIVPKVREADPDLVLQACVFEAVSRDVEKLEVPAWAFEALGRPAEKRSFRYEAMLYPNGRGRDQWVRGNSVPDVSQDETKLWFYYLAATYIDVGCEAIHFGQVEIMNGNDKALDHWAQVFSLVRAYAAKHARRHWVLCDGHVPSGGLLREGKLLLDFHSFPLRPIEVPDRPQEAVLGKKFSDAIYGRSKGGVTPSGWKCEHLPYLVELDNWGASARPGQAKTGGCWTWGYDEITWFPAQDEPYRNQWLKYAWAWVRQNDPAGYLQMPGSRCLSAAPKGKHWYYANALSPATPEGYGQEETIKAIWAADNP